MRFWRFRPRYGLRTLFGVTLLCALGAAWWTRPYEAPQRWQEWRDPDTMWPYEGYMVQPEEVRSCRYTATLRRAFRGAPQRHGPSTLHDLNGRLRVCQDWRYGQLDGLVRKWDAEGRLRFEQEWRDGRQHGMLREWDDKRELRVESEYRDDTCVRATGLWGGEMSVTEYGAPPNPQFVQTRWVDGSRREIIRDWKTRREFEGWHENGERSYAGQWVDGLLDGEWVTWYDDGLVRDQFEYRQGRLISVNGRPVAGLRFPESPTKLEERMTTELNSVSWLEEIETPLADIALMVGDRGGFSVRVDKRALLAAGIDDDPTLSIDRHDVPLSAGLHILLAPHGLTCAIRYEQLWITTPDSELLKGDTTGIEGIVPPPGTNLATAWESQAYFADEIETPLAEVLTWRLADWHQIEIRLEDDLRDAAENDERYRVTASLYYVPLKSAIGSLLYEFDLRCRLEGETLVVYRGGDNQHEDP